MILQYKNLLFDTNNSLNIYASEDQVVIENQVYRVQNPGEARYLVEQIGQAIRNRVCDGYAITPYELHKMIQEYKQDVVYPNRETVREEEKAALTQQPEKEKCA